MAGETGALATLEGRVAPAASAKGNMPNPLRRSPHPLLLEIPARPWLAALSAAAGRRLTLAEVPDAELVRVAERGFHGVWLMGVWRTGREARRLALKYPTLLAEYERLFPDWSLADVHGSPYAIAAYEASPALGGDPALDRLRERLRSHGLGLVLDFVGNHLARDHGWIDEHAEWFVRGTERDLARAPSDWFAHFGRERDAVFAHGRDPHFPGWSDTVQVDYRVRAAREEMARLAAALASRCDGLRCDVAMLLLADVFERTWGAGSNDERGEFWAEAIALVRRERPETVLLAEAYWGLESRMIDLGFDFAYDKGVLDLLTAPDLDNLRRASEVSYDVRRRRAHFLENHDEARAVTVFGESRLSAAALYAYTLPGLRFFYEGQAEGRSARVPIQIGRAPAEEDVPWCRTFYDSLFEALRDPAFHRGAWSAVQARPSAPGDPTHESIFGNRWADAATTWLALSNFSGAQARAKISWTGAVGAAEAEEVSVELAPHEARLLRAPAHTRPPLEASSRG